MMETFYDVKLNDDNFIKTSWMINISKKITEIPSLYIKAGAIHGCALCYKENILAYVEDVGRHNAVDKIAGWMFLNDINGRDKIFYTTGRLTSEMVIKTVQMEIPILLSRSGFTESGVSPFLLLLWMSAPFSISTRAILVLPMNAALCSAV